MVISVVDAPECGRGGTLAGRATGTFDGGSVSVNWNLTCSNGTPGGASYTSIYTVDAGGQLQDSQGMRYTRQ